MSPDDWLRAYLLNSDALPALERSLQAVQVELAPLRPALRRLVVLHLHELVDTVVGTAREGIAADRGAQTTRLSTIKADIIEHLGRRDLTLAAVAARQQLTPRYVQRLFEREGITFSQFVLEQRLVRAHRMLSDPQHDGRTISAVAFAAGFGDLSHFNRAFRRRYGASPSQLRTRPRKAD